MKFAHAIVDDRRADGRMPRASFWMISSPRIRVRCLRRALKKRRPSRVGPVRRRWPPTGRPGDTDIGNAHGVPEDGRIGIVLRIDINAAHELDKLPRFGQVVAAGLIQCFANQVKRHSNFIVPEVQKVSIFGRNSRRFITFPFLKARNSAF